MTGRCLARVRQPSCQAVAARGSPAEPSSGVPSLTWLPGRRGAVEPPAPAQFLRKTRPRAPAAPKRGELEPRFACFSSWAGLLADDSNRQQIYTRWCSNAIRLLWRIVQLSGSQDRRCGAGNPALQAASKPASAGPGKARLSDDRPPHLNTRTRPREPPSAMGLPVSVAGVHRICIHDPRHDLSLVLTSGAGTSRSGPRNSMISEV